MQCERPRGHFPASPPNQLSDSFTLGYMKPLGTLIFSTKTLCHFVQTFMMELMANLIKEQVKVAKSVSTKEQEGLSDQDQSILYYICGFIIRRLSKRYQTKCSSKRQCIQRLKLKTPNSTFVARFRNWKTKSERGGLLTPCDELFLLVGEFETVLRNCVNLNDLSSTSLLCDRLKESILECYMVKYYCEKLWLWGIYTSVGTREHSWTIFNHTRICNHSRTEKQDR